MMKVWAWLKRYWKYLLFPVGILLGVLAMLNRRKNLGNIVPPLEVDTEPEREEANREAEEKARKAQVDKERRIEELKKEHAGTLRELTGQQRVRVDELKDDPDALNDYLLEVGRGIRG